MRVEGLGLGASGFGFQASGLGLRVSGFETGFYPVWIFSAEEEKRAHQVSNFGFRIRVKFSGEGSRFRALGEGSGFGLYRTGFAAGGSYPVRIFSAEEGK